MEDHVHDAERPVRNRSVFIVRVGSRVIDASRRVDAKSRRTGVRGTIVASKPGHSGGAKGSRKMDVG